LPNAPGTSSYIPNAVTKISRCTFFFSIDGNRVTLIEADATDEAALENALDQIDVVFASLAGNILANTTSI
jgi:hypothetical protein